MRAFTTIALLTAFNALVELIVYAVNSNISPQVVTLTLAGFDIILFLPIVHFLKQSQPPELKN